MWGHALSYPRSSVSLAVVNKEEDIQVTIHKCLLKLLAQSKQNVTMYLELEQAGSKCDEEHCLVCRRSDEEQQYAALKLYVKASAELIVYINLNPDIKAYLENGEPCPLDAPTTESLSDIMQNQLNKRYNNHQGEMDIPTRDPGEPLDCIGRLLAQRIGDTQVKFTELTRNSQVDPAVFDWKSL